MINKEQKILGAFEIVDFPLFGMVGVEAKIDTGAETGALHCTKIREVTEDGAQVLYFSPFDHPESEYRADKFMIDTVKSSNGTSQERYFIRTSIRVQGKRYRIKLSLADRSDMMFPVLIGRRFLGKYGFLVDVRMDGRV